MTEQLLVNAADRNGRAGAAPGATGSPRRASEPPKNGGVDANEDRLLALLNDEALEEETVEIEVDPTNSPTVHMKLLADLPGRPL